MVSQQKIEWKRRLAWIAQVFFGIVALLNTKVPPNGKALATVIADALAGGKQAVGFAEVLTNLNFLMSKYDARILNGPGAFAPSTATGITVATMMSLGFLWASRWLDGSQAPRRMEKCLDCAVPFLLVLLALTSPTTAMAVAVAQMIFQYSYPPPRDVYVFHMTQQGVGMTKVT